MVFCATWRDSLARLAAAALAIGLSMETAPPVFMSMMFAASPIDPFAKPCPSEEASGS
ncbi:hypothetical protein DPMN_114679 [Dreissena polymorpha]|uniref:Uncharacterized protein n=1 Tax=Dreissena polymorpha TaxID=45954 RepID=A0A9D4KKD5_DREPO|nr:hypothetical protein DPMN_114679 [Dreissena polymorpha]